MIDEPEILLDSFRHASQKLGLSGADSQINHVALRAPSDENLNETLQRVFKNIEGSAVGAQSEDDLEGLFIALDVNMEVDWKSWSLPNSDAKMSQYTVSLFEKCILTFLPCCSRTPNCSNHCSNAVEFS